MTDRRLTVILVLSLVVQGALLVSVLLTFGEVRRMEQWAEKVCDAIEDVRDTIKPPAGFLGPTTNCADPPR